jgi:hypothetical protein
MRYSARGQRAGARAALGGATAEKAVVRSRSCARRPRWPSLASLSCIKRFWLALGRLRASRPALTTNSRRTMKEVLRDFPYCDTMRGNDDDDSHYCRCGCSGRNRRMVCDQVSLGCGLTRVTRSVLPAELLTPFPFGDFRHSSYRCVARMDRDIYRVTKSNLRQLPRRPRPLANPAGRHDGAVLRIGLVVLLDVIDVVEIIHH